MPRQTPDSDHHYYGPDRGRRERDDYHDRYSKSHQLSYGKERRSYRDRDSSPDDRTTQKYSRGRSRSRSVSRSKYSKRSSRRSRSRSRSKYDYHSDRRRSRSRSYDEKRRSRSRSYSRRSKRSRSKHSPRHKHHKLTTEISSKQSVIPQKHLTESSEVKEKSVKDVENSKNYDIQRYTEMYSNINIPESDKSSDTNYEYYDENDDSEYQNMDNNYEPIDKEKIHREIEEKLRETLAKEGKIYPPRKTEASHPIFANDGSFLEVFKKMQEQANNNQIKQKSGKIEKVPISNPAPVPVISKRRGGRILKTGVVAKPSTRNPDNNDPKDFWALYLEEVKKYKNATCDIDGKTRPLVK